MSEIETRNAVIKSTALGYDGSILSAWLHLEYGGSGQGFGGYGLDAPPPPDNRQAGRQPHAVAGFFIQRVLEVVGVRKWEDLTGKHVRVRCEHSKLHAIGHILEDNWFEPGVEFGSLHGAD